MGKKKLQKMLKKLDKLEDKLYSSMDHIPKEDILLAKMSKSLKAYYDRIPPERQKALLSYIIKQEEYESLATLNGLEMREEEEYVIPPKKCNTLRDVIDDINKRRKLRKKPKKKFKHMLKTDEGLYVLINPEMYDHTLLSKKAYRKYLSKLASKEGKTVPVLDCTLKNFKEELLNNPNVNAAVTEAFYAKYKI